MSSSLQSISNTEANVSHIDVDSHINLQNVSSDADCWFHSKGLKIGFLNIHYLLTKIDQVKELLGKQAPDIFGFSETFLNANITDSQVQLPTSLARLDRLEEDGILLYHK